MQPSMFNLRVPLPGREEVFLMNTLTDAQMVVSSDVVSLLDRASAHGATERELDEESRDALTVLREHGFLVESREADRRALDNFFVNVRGDRSELHVTILTTLQCNFACDYCFQGDHGDYNKFADKMSPETASQVSAWIERELDRVRPERLVLMFFGGEPLLNLQAMYTIAEDAATAARARGIRTAMSIITNGLLLTRDVVMHMMPLGLRGVKI